MSPLVNPLKLKFPKSPEIAFDVRAFTVQERLSDLFSVTLHVRSPDSAVDFDQLVGKPAKFEVMYGEGFRRAWTGTCTLVEQLQVLDEAERHLTTYRVVIVPDLWTAAINQDYEVFQNQSEPDIATKILDERKVKYKATIDKAGHPKRKYVVQYGESDFDFLSRLLESTGVTFYFKTAEPKDAPSGEMVLTDCPETAPRRAALPWVAEPHGRLTREFVTDVVLGRRFRPGRYTLGDYDHRRPRLPLRESADDGLPEERGVERFVHIPGAFLFEGEASGETPAADDRGAYRPNAKHGKVLAKRRLTSSREDTLTVSFLTTALDLQPGTVTSIEAHPHPLLQKMSLLVVSSTLSGNTTSVPVLQCVAVSADVPYHPPRRTTKPIVDGVESAVVVGPPGQEIHTDEFGRVRVQFHWDRQGKLDEKSCCWLHVSQPWAGTGFGGSCIPRVGQEVLVAFFGGDPDRPIVVGRVYNGVSKTPWKLPQSSTQSGIRTNSTGGAGGHNELMFEDKRGHELVRIRAERDLVKNVQANEVERTGSSRSIDVAATLTIQASDINIEAKRIRINGVEFTDVKGGVIKLNC